MVSFRIQRRLRCVVRGLLFSRVWCSALNEEFTKAIFTTDNIIQHPMFNHTTDTDLGENEPSLVVVRDCALPRMHFLPLHLNMQLYYKICYKITKYSLKKLIV